VKKIKLITSFEMKVKYFPTPTIIEAAQSLYSGQNVKEISRSHAGAENLTETTNAVISAIKEAQTTNSKDHLFHNRCSWCRKNFGRLKILCITGNLKQMKKN
jgi:hypothetical protein